VEGLLGVFGELLEEEGKQGIHILASSDSVGDLATAVGVSDVHGLVEEDNGGVLIPSEVVELHLALLGDGRRAELHEETHQ
jgi:hypothetical protein